MIKTRLFTLVTDAKKYIIANVILQWFSMMANVVMVYAIAWILRYCIGGSQEALSKLPYLFGIALVTVIIRIVCTKYAATTSFYASKSVKKELRGAIYQKLLRLGSSYRLEVPTAEVVQLAGEGVEQLETYFGSYLPQFFYS
ncbi:MAG: cysteine ABC transporter ATP-binding protein, partial [Lachnospiraceae bacterium]|nr:cysteine ABC transporter ATP-binding protein [Lachnospiraceae bacterium]